MNEKERGLRERFPVLTGMYDKIPGPQDIAPPGGAPIDALLNLIMKGLGQGSSGINPGLAAGQWGNSAISSLLSEFGVGQPPAVAAPSGPVDMFGEPVAPSRSIDNDPNSPNFGKSVIHYEQPEYPPPGVDTVAWAEANPPPPDQALPPGESDPNFVPGPVQEFGITPEDIKRWSEVLQSTTTVEKQPEIKKQGPNSPPVPKRKPKPLPRAARPETWDTVITGLGGYVP